MPLNQLSSRNTVLFFKKLESVYPYKEGIKIVREIMALNFLKRFDKYLKEKGIKQNYISKMPMYKWIC